MPKRLVSGEKPHQKQVKSQDNKVRTPTTFQKRQKKKTGHPPLFKKDRTPKKVRTATNFPS